MKAVLPLDATILLGVIFTLPLLALLHLMFMLLRKFAKWRKLVPRDAVSWSERRWTVWSSAGLLVLYMLCYAYGTFIEAHWVKLSCVELEVDRPVLGHERFRIVHLSDLHLEKIGGRERRALRLVREADPHLILLTGDYLNRRDAGEALEKFLGRLEAPYGVLAIPGNWDRKFPVRDHLEAAGVAFLEDESRLIGSGEGALRVVGNAVRPVRPLRELLRDRDGDAVTIYLHHMPEGIDELERRDPGQRVDLFLCGHTHGGQVCLPFWGAIITLSKHHKRFESGLYDVDGVAMYVNRGVGMEGGASPRVRFWCRPEVALIELVAR